MFKAMKRAMLLMSAQKQGYNTYAKNKTWKAKPTEEKSALLRNYREEKVAELEKYGDVAFLPPHWLTFLLCSLPMMVYFPNKKMTLDCLVPPEVASSRPMEASLVPTLPKTVRRAQRAAVSTV